MKRLRQLRYIKNLGQVWRYFTSEIKSIELAITYNCNFHCKGCYAADLKEQIFMPKEQVLKILEQYKPMHVNLTGGEPLLHPDLLEIISGISKSVVVSIVTNGSLLTEEKLLSLKEVGLNTIQISYGINYPILHNTSLAIKAAEIGLNTCLSVTNTFSNKEIIKLAIQYSSKYNWHVLFNLPYGDLEKEFDKETYLKYRNNPMVREDNMFWNGKDKCPAGTKKIYITAKGELMPCDRIHEVFNSYEEMKEYYKRNNIFCTRWGDLV